MHWPARQPPESVRDGIDRRRLVPAPAPRFIHGRSSRAPAGAPRSRPRRRLRSRPARPFARPSAGGSAPRERLHRRAVVRREGGLEGDIPPTGWDRALGVRAIVVRRSRALGGVPRCEVVFPRVSSSAASRSPARPRVAPTTVARASSGEVRTIGKERGSQPRLASRSTQSCSHTRARSSGRTSSSTARSKSTPPSSEPPALRVHFYTNVRGTFCKRLHVRAGRPTGPVNRVPGRRGRRPLPHGSCRSAIDTRAPRVLVLAVVDGSGASGPVFRCVFWILRSCDSAPRCVLADAPRAVPRASRVPGSGTALNLLPLHFPRSSAWARSCAMAFVISRSSSGMSSGRRPVSNASTLARTATLSGTA